MIMVTEDPCERENNEKVLEVISFDSHEHEGAISMEHVLKSMTQLSEKEKSPSRSRNDDPLLVMRTKQAVQAMGGILGTARQLRQELDSYKFYLLSALSDWEVQAISNFKAVRDRIDACLAGREEGGRYLALQQEVAMLGRSLALEREAREAQRRENAELEEKVRRAERGQSEQRLRVGSEAAQVEELRGRAKRLELELSEARLECEAHAAKVGKLKEVIR